MIARPGAFPPHFAHQHQNPNCKRPPGESDLHALAKSLIQHQGKIGAPGRKTLISLERIEAEVPLSNFYMDLMAKDSAGRDIVIEFTVEHESSLHKIRYLKQNGIASMEVDLRGAVHPPNLEEWIVTKAPRRWIVNPAESKPETTSILHWRQTYRRYKTIWGPYTQPHLEQELNDLRKQYGLLNEVDFNGTLCGVPESLRGRLPKSRAFVRCSSLPTFYDQCAFIPGHPFRKRDKDKPVRFRLSPNPRGILYLTYQKKGVFFPEVTSWQYI